MDELKTLEALGFTLPSPTYLFGVLLSSIIGYVAYRYGKQCGLMAVKWTGIALMLFPYAVSESCLLYLIGTGLCIGIFILCK